MAEYNVYSNRGNQIDWSQIASGLSGEVTKWDESIKGKRAEDQRLFQEANKLLNETESNKSQTLNEFVLAGADVGRTQINSWYKDLKDGKISRSEFKRRDMNLKENWANLAAITKTLDQRIQESLARQQVGENGEIPQASEIEVLMQGYFGSMANLKDKKLDIDNDGTVMLTTLGPDGKPVQFQNIKYMNNPLNINYGRVDVSGMVKAEVENWGKWSIGRISDQRNNPQYNKMKTQLIETLTSSPRSASSVLVDYTNDDYTVYFNEQDKQAKLAELKRVNEGSGVNMSDAELESKLIQMQQDSNGDYQPVLTDAQIKKAKEVVAREIEMQVGRDVEPAPMYSGGGGGSSSSGKGEEDPNQLIAGYKASLRAFGFNPDKVKGNLNNYKAWSDGKVDLGGLSNNFKYYYDPKAKVVKVYSLDSQGGLEGATGLDNNVLFIAKNPKDLAQYIYMRPDASKNAMLWEDARKMFLGGSSLGSTAPKTSTVTGGKVR